MRPLPLAALIATLLATAVPCSAQDLDELPDDKIAETSRTPMYGQPAVRRPAELALADSAYVHGITEDFQGDRRAASVDSWANGEWNVFRGRLNIAMSRYNQAWLLDHSNYRAYWGFGRVLLLRNETRDAIRHLEEAWRLAQSPSPNVAVLAELASAHSQHAANLQGTPDQRTRHLATANQKFEECLKLDPTFAYGWLQWARALHREGKHADAWKKVAKARELRTELPAPFIGDLEKAMPEPKGGRP